MPMRWPGRFCCGGGSATMFESLVGAASRPFLERSSFHKGNQNQNAQNAMTSKAMRFNNLSRSSRATEAETDCSRRTAFRRFHLRSRQNRRKPRFFRNTQTIPQETTWTGARPCRRRLPGSRPIPPAWECRHLGLCKYRTWDSFLAPVTLAGILEIPYFAHQ
jgi:hypothetical protein